MFYEFPKNITLDEVRSAVKNANTRLGTNLFIEADRDDHVIFNYAFSFREVWDVPETGIDREHAILRECRGLTFMKDGTLIARKFHKFFNVNERHETLFEHIDWAKPHCILEKLDGSMITPFPYGWPTEYEVRWCTKMGMTDVAAKVEPFISRNPQYDKFARFCLKNSITPIFEFCSLNQRIVITYPKERLVLLAARDNVSGEYFSYDELHEWGNQFDVEVVSKLFEGAAADTQAFISEVRGMLGVEGFVPRFEKGHMVKIKADEYCMIHGTVSDLVSEKKVVAMIANDLIDDTLPLLPDDDRVQMEKFIADWNAGIGITVAEIHRLSDEGVAQCGEDRRAFAEYVATLPHLYQGHVHHARVGKNVRESILHRIKTNIGTAAKVEAVRSLWGGHVWEYGAHLADKLDE